MEEFIDAESTGQTFQTKASISFQDITLRHLNRICQLSCDEFTGGYVNKKLINFGGISQKIETYVPDQRKRYIQAVNTLYDLTYSFFDKVMNKEDIKLDEERKKEKDINKLIEVSRKRFRSLVSLLKRLNFLKEEDIT